MKGKTTYCERVWLNDRNSPSTGNAVAYDGTPVFQEGPYHSMFLRISDCHQSIRLHKAEYDTEQDFIIKMKRLRALVDRFITHLESAYQEPMKR